MLNPLLHFRDLCINALIYYRTWWKFIQRGWQSSRSLYPALPWYLNIKSFQRQIDSINANFDAVEKNIRKRAYQQIETHWGVSHGVGAGDEYRQ